MPLISTEEKLSERVKELSCLYSMSVAFLKSESVPETLIEICAIVKAAWRFPDDAIVCLSVEEFSFSTASLPADTIHQQTNLILFNEIKGQISVHYDSKRHAPADFLPDEQLLLEKIAFDIARFYEKHLHEQEISVLKRGMQRSDRLAILGEITAGIAHELNTPLGNILGFAELIASRTSDDQTLQDVNKVIKAAIYSREIVKKLMFFSCEMPQHMQLIKIKPVVEQALTLLEPNFKKAHVSAEFEISDSNLEAQIDPIQFTQMLFNILVNAIYVSPEGATIGTKIYSDPYNLIVEIKDNGPGIESQNLQKIFEPFFTTKPFGEGNGLGLSVVHGIVKSHRGQISAEQNFPQGTTFKIQLPLKHPQ